MRPFPARALLRHCLGIALAALLPLLPAAALAQQPESAVEAPAAEFLLGPGDMVAVSVLEDPALDRQVLVRPDGRISLPLAGAPMAAGQTPEALAAEVQRALGPNFVQPPTVTVSLVSLAPEAEQEDEALPVIYVIGEVNKPGSYQVEGPVGLLQALALAGGPGTYAAKKRVQVRQRSEDGQERVTVVNFKALERGAAAPGLLLGDGDTVVVPERGLFE